MIHIQVNVKYYYGNKLMVHIPDYTCTPMFLLPSVSVLIRMPLGASLKQSIPTLVKELQPSEGALFPMQQQRRMMLHAVQVPRLAYVGGTCDCISNILQLHFFAFLIDLCSLN